MIASVEHVVLVPTTVNPVLHVMLQLAPEASDAEHVPSAPLVGGESVQGAAAQDCVLVSSPLVALQLVAVPTKMYPAEHEREQLVPAARLEEHEPKEPLGSVSTVQLGEDGLEVTVITLPIHVCPLISHT